MAASFFPTGAETPPKCPHLFAFKACDTRLSAFNSPPSDRVPTMIEVTPVPVGLHGAYQLPAVTVDSWNIELRDRDGFIGNRATKRAFNALVESLRTALKDVGDDPLAGIDVPQRKKLEKVLFEGEHRAAGVVLAAIEKFAVALAGVIARFLKTAEWKDTERIVVGGGFRAGRIGELVIGRAELKLAEDGISLPLVPICNPPDEAGLIGAVHLAPSWIFAGHDAVLAIDIGGTNARAGIVALNQQEASDLSAAKVVHIESWRHADDRPDRKEAVTRIIAMVEGLIGRATADGYRLAPFIGVGCPGFINPDGSIDRGSQNLPGNWESDRFNFPRELYSAVPRIGDHETAIIMHNDAVVQGLSELSRMRETCHWGVLTIGTGLGNARFTNREESCPPSRKQATRAKGREPKL